MGFWPTGVNLDALYRAHHNALGLVEVPNAFSAFRWVDFVNELAHVNGLIRALGFADITIDAFVGYFQCHQLMCRLHLLV